MGDFNLKKYQNHGLKVELLTFFVSSSMLVSLPIFLVLQKVKAAHWNRLFSCSISFFPSLFSSTYYLSQINTLLVFQAIETIPVVCYHR